MVTDERKLVWTADEIGAATFRFVHPLDDGAEVLLAPLSRMAGLERAGINLIRVPPGRRAFPLHRHHVEEEWVWVVSGTAEVRLDAERHRIGPGGLAVFPPGGPAHAVENPSADTDLVCLTGGENAPGEIVDFPEAGRRIVRGRGLFQIGDADAFSPFDYFSRSPLPERTA
jgi:uncharacterized cupin superfamily protein